MLIDEPNIERSDRDIVLNLISGGKRSNHLSTGVYEIGHFGHSHFMPGYKDSWDVGLGDLSAYGVCDNVWQIFAECPLIPEDPVRKFVITLTPIYKAEQPYTGGWRWHKWGPYIGKHKAECEYLHDEVGIEKVLVYHVYEKE